MTQRTCLVSLSFDDEKINLNDFSEMGKEIINDIKIMGDKANCISHLDNLLFEYDMYPSELKYMLDILTWYEKEHKSVLTWTKELPTVPGFYWYRDVTKSYHPRIFEMLKRKNRKDKNGNHKEGTLYVVYDLYDRYGKISVKDLSNNFVWAGPINFPEDGL